MKTNFSHIEERATEILKVNGLFKPNFDIKVLCRKLGITLVEKTLGEDVSGFLILTDNQRIITINDKNHTTRQKFTIAHEIGHFIFHSKTQPLFVDKAPKVLYRNLASSTGEDFREREANAFAASLLMPTELMEEQIYKSPADISKAITFLANKFGVSENTIPKI